MKRVILVRHAKAVPYGYDDDYNRELTDRGENDAENIGKRLFSMNIKPDYISSSPASRALKTARIFAESLSYPKDQIVEDMDLYDGVTSQEFIDMLRNLPDNVEVAFYFGHNPTFYYLANSLLRHFNNDMPTCSTVAIDFDINNWVKIGAREGTMVFQLNPKMFR